MKRLSNRGYTGQTLRLFTRSRNLHKYTHRFEYLKKMKSNKDAKEEKALYFANKLISDPSQSILSISEISEMKQKYEPEIDEKEIEIIDIYWKKQYEQLFDDDREIRNILTKFNLLLPQDFAQKVKFKICNRVGTKIGRYLN